MWAVDNIIPAEPVEVPIVRFDESAYVEEVVYVSPKHFWPTYDFLEPVF